MIVPVLRTTGVNTKILVALELGVPLVITPVAASPFDLPDNETVVAFADQALDFVQQTVSVYTVSWLWTQLARSSRQHWENLATHDPARNDVRTMLATVCGETTEAQYLSGWTPPPIPNEPPPVLMLPAPEAPPRRRPSACFAANASALGAPLLLVGSHSLGDVFPKFTLYVTTPRLEPSTRAPHAPHRATTRRPSARAGKCTPSGSPCASSAGSPSPSPSPSP